MYMIPYLISVVGGVLFVVAGIIAYKAFKSWRLPCHIALSAIIYGLITIVNTSIWHAMLQIALTSNSTSRTWMLSMSSRVSSTISLVGVVIFIVLFIYGSLEIVRVLREREISPH